MSISRRSCLLGLVALPLGLSSARLAIAAETPLLSAIDAAGQQRMLIQRIVKAYCQLGMKVTPETARAQLSSAVRRFNRQLTELSKAPPSAAAQRALARVAALWAPFRRQANGAVSRTGARNLVKLGEPLLQATHDAVLALQDAAATPLAQRVNVAGRQRMLSQRLAMLYMLRAWGVDSSGIRDQMESARNEFAGAQESLRAATENTPQIAKELDAVALQWEWFSSAIKLQGAQSFTLIVADASESILNSMDLITALYAELPRN